MNPTDTPETDAARLKYNQEFACMAPDESGKWVEVEFARKLERERNAALAIVGEFMAIADRIDNKKARPG